jgi:hypothetical protein
MKTGRDASQHAFDTDQENCRSLGFPGFPVELGGAGEFHAPFLTESRTRGPVLCCVAGNPASLGMTKGKVVVFSFAFDAKPENRRSLRYTPPDFLWRLVASANFMRLSLRKDAHAAVSSAAWQEIRVRSGRDDNSFLTLTFPIINLCGVHSTSTFRSSQLLG